MVKPSPVHRTYVAGEIVSVPWGLDIVQGTIIGSYGSGPTERLIVRVSVPGTDDQPEVTFPAKVIEDAEIARRQGDQAPGSWLTEYGYEQALKALILSILAHRGRSEELSEGDRAADVRPDFVITGQSHPIYVEARTHVTPKVVDQVLSWNRALPAATAHVAAWLIVSAEAPKPDVLNKIDRARADGVCIKLIEWLKPQDDRLVADAIAELESAWTGATDL